MNCTNCGYIVEENFCTRCGEKKFDPKHLSIKHFAEETFEGFVHFDNKFFSTLKLLFSRPGQLSLDHVVGKQSRHMKPIAFFLVVNLLFFLLMKANPYSLSLTNYVTYKPFINYNTQHIIKEKIAKLNVTQAEYAKVFDTKIHADSKAYIFAFIPLYAIICAILFIAFKRRAGEHFVFAIHIVSFILCYFFLQINLVVMPYYFITKSNFNADIEVVTYYMSVLIVGGYFAIAAKRFYYSGWLWSLVAGAAIGYTFFYMIQLYRMLLFYEIVFL